MTTKELAAEIRCTPKTIRRFVKIGLVDATPLGGSKGFEFGDDAPTIIRHILKTEHYRLVKIANKKRAASLAIRSKSHDRLQPKA